MIEAIKSGIRPYFGQLGIALLGPNPKEEERRERTENIRVLQEVVNRASEFESLAHSVAFQKWQAIAAGKVKELSTQLRRAGTDDFEVIQARLLAFEEATSIVPSIIAEADAARAEIQRLEREA